MTSGLTTKVRLVRCPRCRKLLTELADVPVYECGGCGTVLQAKNHKNDVRNTRLVSEETDPVHVNDLEYVSEDNEFSSSSKKAIHIPTEECALDQNHGGQNESVNCNREQPGGIDFSNEVSSSTELDRPENDESSPVAGAISEVDENNESELPHPENDESSPVAGANSEVDENHESELSHTENDESSPVGGANSEVDENNESELLHPENDESSPVAGANSQVDENSESELSHPENDESSPVAGANSEVDEHNEGGSNFKNSSTDNLVATRQKSSIITAEWPIIENISSNIPISQHNEQQEQSRKSVLHGLDRVRSRDTLEPTELINPSSELSGTLRDMSKSPTKSSHAYDGSISSYDGADDQVFDQYLHLYKRTYKAADIAGTEERPKRDKLPVNNTIRKKSEMHHQARNSLSISSNKKHHGVWDSDEPLEPTRHGYPISYQMRLERGEFPSRVPFYLRGSQAGYENGSPSSHGYNEFQCSSSCHSPNRPEYPEQEKIKLMRMVDELQDQLKRTQFANGRVPTGVAWKEKKTPTYYDHEAPEEEICHDLNHPRCLRRHGQGKNWTQQCRFSQMPFSGEATNSRLQVDHLCMHSCPQDWQRSVRLPPPIQCFNNGLCRIPPGHNCHHPHSSSPSSPLRYVDSEFHLWNRGTKSDDQRHRGWYMGSEISSWGRDTKSDDQRHKDRAVKKYYLREKRHLVKRHFRPIAGGAPFITCSRCLALLQLPADFLLFKKRYHRLKCSACSGVLEFSLESSTHIVSYTPSATDPPPSEVDESGDAINLRNLASASHPNDCPHAEPVSSSDDYGLSFCKSCSTEGEPVLFTPPFHALQGSADDRKIPSGTSFEPMTEREKKFVLKQWLKKCKNPVETCEPAGPSSNMEKISSEIEELAPKKGSPLHWLMGYSSPRAVINGSGVGTSSSYPVKNPRSRS